MLISAGLVIVVAGAVVMLGERAGVRLGHLPGDIRVEGKNGSFSFPIVTCVLVSVIGSLALWLFRR